MEAPPRRPVQGKPPGYRVLCISMYDEDVERLIARVAELRRRGVKNASRSWLIRRALSDLNMDTIARDPDAGPETILSDPPSADPKRALEDIAILAMTATQSAFERPDKNGDMRRAIFHDIRQRARRALGR